MLILSICCNKHYKRDPGSRDDKDIKLIKYQVQATPFFPYCSSTWLSFRNLVLKIAGVDVRATCSE